jgi:hypothetical protein
MYTLSLVYVNVSNQGSYNVIAFAVLMGIIFVMSIYSLRLSSQLEVTFKMLFMSFRIR